MSRIGKKPIELPAGVTAVKSGPVLKLEGPRGTLECTLRPEIDVLIQDRKLLVKPAANTRKTPAYWGTSRSVISRMVEGVSRGFEKRLEIEGIGYRAQLDGDSLNLSLGFSHPVKVAASPGITFKVEKNVIIISGIDAEAVGDITARIRRLRPPEPYKGKGIRYQGEIIRRKAGKKAVTTA